MHEGADKWTHGHACLIFVRVVVRYWRKSEIKRPLARLFVFAPDKKTLNTNFTVFYFVFNT